MRGPTDPLNDVWLAMVQGTPGQSRLTNRRDFLLTLASGLSVTTLAIPSIAQTQSVPRIGFVRHGSPDPFSESFRQGLRDLGYAEGKSIIVEYRWTEGKIERIAPLVEELMRLKVTVIVGAGEPVLNTLHKMTKTVPVVMTNSQSPVGSGFAASLARPGGNMTGNTGVSPALAGKRVELLRDLLPGMRRIAILWDRAVDLEQMKSAQAAAKTLGVASESIEVRKPDALQSAFSAAQKAQADALTIIGSSVMFAERTYIAILAVKAGIPAIYPQSGFVDAGGLMSYGTNFADLFKRAAAFVDKILKGAKPADLPIEQPTRFELVLNMKTAKLLGLTFPPEIMVRADRVIQ